MKPLRQRKSPRLRGYDYSSEGAYFVTICTHQRRHLFGSITDGNMCLSAAGDIAAACWRSIPQHYPAVELDAFVIMPNHVHGILFLHGDSGAFKTILGRVINAYKGAVTARIRSTQSDDGLVWQGRYHDHIIRDPESLSRIQQYVEKNPLLWSEDVFFAQE